MPPGHSVQRAAQATASARAPRAEVLKQAYGQKSDLWSAGVLAYQLLTGRLPFVGDNGLLVSTLYMTKQVRAVPCCAAGLWVAGR